MVKFLAVLLMVLSIVSCSINATTVDQYVRDVFDSSEIPMRTTCELHVVLEGTGSFVYNWLVCPDSSPKMIDYVKFYRISYIYELRMVAYQPVILKYDTAIGQWVALP